jgi:rhamnosyltransferase
MSPVLGTPPGAAVPHQHKRGYTFSSMKYSIVIRAYNESRHLGRLLEGLAQQTCGDTEVILVDSGSTDATIQIAETRGAKIVRIPPAEFTFGRSLNLGLAAASADLVVIASAHVYPVYPDWLACLLRPFDDPGVALVYGKQRGAAGSKFSEHQIFRQWFPDADVHDQPSPFCNNANAAIRRNLWEEHAYDETLTGLEDLAWARWVQSRGYRVAYAAHAEVVHIHQESLKAVYDRYRREAMAFKRIFPESHFNIYDCVRLTTAHILNDLLEAACRQVFARSLVSVLWFRGAQFWGTYQGYRNSGPVTQQLRQRFYYPGGMDSSQPGSRDVQPIRYNEAAVRQGSDRDGPA